MHTTLKLNPKLKLELELELKLKFSDIVFIVSSNPKKDLLELFKAYFVQNQYSEQNIIHKKSQVSSLAIIGDSVSIGAFAVIEDNVEIGDNSVIGPNTIIKSDTVIGNNVIIGSNNVIGGVGFGYVKDQETNEYDSCMVLILHGNLEMMRTCDVISVN